MENLRNQHKSTDCCELLKHRACADIRQQLDEDGVLDAAVENGRALNALADRLNAAVHLRDHAALDDAVAHELRHFRNLESMQHAVFIVDVEHQAAHIGQQDEFFRTERNGELARCGIGIDVVVGLVIDALRNGRNDRDVTLLKNVDDRRRVNVNDVADVAVICARAVGQALCLKQAARPCRRDRCRGRPPFRSG